MNKFSTKLATVPGRLEILNSFLLTEVLIWQEIPCSFRSKVEANKQELMRGSEKQKQIQLIFHFVPVGFHIPIT